MDACVDVAVAVAVDEGAGVGDREGDVGPMGAGVDDTGRRMRAAAARTRATDSGF